MTATEIQTRPQVLLTPSPRILDLGSGRDRALPGATRVDITPDTQPDVVHDLDEVPWPFAADSFDIIQMKDVIEHLTDIVATMEEVHRVGRAGARVHIMTPHFSCANSYTDPTHKHHLGVHSMDYFTGEHQHDFYSRARFRLVKSDLVFHAGPLRPILRRLARRWPDAYEHKLAWILPAWFLIFELEILK